MYDEAKTRKNLRFEPTPGEPISVSFKQPELRRMESRIKVRDISLDGLGLRVPLGSKAIREGMVIEGIEIKLPGSIKCVLSGKVVYKRLGNCGIEFVEVAPAELRKLRAYTSLMEREQKQVGKKA